MQDIHIKTEHLPNRCEICHQSDYFDPINNSCSRCVKLQNTIESLDPKNQSAIRNLENQPLTLKYAYPVYVFIMCTVFPFVIYLITTYNKDFIKSWYISLIPFIYWITLTSINIAKIKKALKTIGDTIKTKEHLSIIKPVINFNMMAAISLMAFCVLYFSFLGLFLSSSIFKGSAHIHFLIFTVLTINFAMINKYYETKLKTLKVDSKDSKIAQTYELWVKQWEEPGFKLPD